MRKDGDLRNIFRDKFRAYQWTSVETAGTSSGVPDSEFCTPEGIQGWIEYKKTNVYAVNIRPFQVSWLDRRWRYGGKAWIAVRRIPIAEKDTGVDELWLMQGDQATALFNRGLNGVSAMCWSGGPSNWNFQEIHEIFKQGFIL